MANPSYRSSATVSATTNATFSVTKPAGTVDGDLLVAFQFTLLGGGSTPATPTGWTAGTTQLHATNTALLQLFYKVASSEGASWIFNNSDGLGATASVRVIAVQDAASPPEGTAKTSGSSATADPGAYVTTHDNDLVLTVWSIPTNISGTITPHASYTALGAIGGSGGLMNVGYKSQAAAGSTANTTAALDTTYAWGAMTVAVNGSAPPAPVANFTGTPLSVAVGVPVVFTDSSTNTPTSWDWNFGDGTTHGTTQNPSHTYTTPGTYTVALIATNAGGSDTKTRTGYVTVTPGGGSAVRVRAVGGSVARNRVSRRR